MQARKAARVLPEPVGAEISVGSPARIAGQPAVWGSVGEPNFVRNHSCTMGCAHARAGVWLRSAAGSIGMKILYLFAACSLRESVYCFAF